MRSDDLCISTLKANDSLRRYRTAPCRRERFCQALLCQALRGGHRPTRIERRKEHLLIDILGLTVCAAICGADGFVSTEEYGKSNKDWSNKDWLERFLKLPSGIPSHETIGGVLARIDPEEFEEGLRARVDRHDL